jgi:hypothetical protein
MELLLLLLGKNKINKNNIFRHPLDTIKTKMQAQKNHLTNSSFNVVIKTLKNEGIVGLYRKKKEDVFLLYLVLLFYDQYNLVFLLLFTHYFLKKNRFQIIQFTQLIQI